MREGNHTERGFTLIELMVVVAIVAILAIIVIPTFFSEVKKAKGDSEVNAMFAEITTKLEQYKLEKSVYLDAVQCPSTGPNNSGYNFKNICMTSGSTWERLAINPPESTMRCAYTIVIGAAGTAMNVPSPFVTSTGTTGAEATASAVPWWYLLAECDTDGKGSTSTNTKFFQSSLNSKLQKANEGQ